MSEDNALCTLGLVAPHLVLTMFASLAGPLVGCGGSIPEGASASPGGQAVSEVRPVRPERDSLHHNDEPQGHGLGTWTLPEMRTGGGSRLWGRGHVARLGPGFRRVPLGQRPTAESPAKSLGCRWGLGTSRYQGT